MFQNTILRASAIAVIALGGSVLALSARNSQEGMMPTPTDHHKVMKDMVGDWNAACTFHMMGGQTMKGTESITSLGGFWMVSEFKGDFMGLPFVGIAQMGYDSKKKKYVGTWVDSSTESLTVMEGTYDDKTKTIAMEYEQDMGGMMVKTVSHTTFVDDENTRDYKAWMVQDGERTPMMEIHYTRKE